MRASITATFPQEMAPGIRSGALKMIIFEELVYQEAQRRKMTVSPERLNSAEADFRKQFATPEEYQQFLKTEFQGSEQLLREKIKRSLLIDQLLKAEVDKKSTVSLAELKAYYDKNPARFNYPEAFAFQTITLLPPDKPTPALLKEQRKRADDALRQAKAANTDEVFGMLAEKISEDDYRVMMGYHKPVDRAKLPPIVVQALLTMQPGPGQRHYPGRAGLHHPAAGQARARRQNEIRRCQRLTAKGTAAEEDQRPSRQLR